MHDATKVQLGSTQSSFRVVTNHIGAIAAGLCVHLKSDNTISLAAADGSKIGISLGKSLSDTSRTAICRRGSGVPVLLANGFTPTIGAQVQFSTTTGKAVASGTAVNAYYKSAVLSAILEDGTTDADGCALIDFPGGL